MIDRLTFLLTLGGGFLQKCRFRPGLVVLAKYGNFTQLSRVTITDVKLGVILDTLSLKVSKVLSLNGDVVMCSGIWKE